MSGAWLDIGKDPCLTSITRLEWGLDVEFNHDMTFNLPYLFLRDSCSSAFDRRTGHRFFSVANVSDAPVAEDAGIVKKKGYNGLLVLWKDGTESNFESGWLLQKCMCVGFPSSLVTQPRLWGSDDMTGKISTFDFREIVGDDKTQLQLLEALVERDGLALIRGLPCRQSSLRDIGNRMFASSNLIRPFQIKIDLETKDGKQGETRGARAIHSELSYGEDVPGIMVMLCVKLKAGRQDSEGADRPEDTEKGGNLLLVDGFQLAQTLKESFPGEYATLCDTPVSFRKSGYNQSEECELLASRPVFTVNCEGQVVRVCIDEEHRTRWEASPSAAGVWLASFHTATGVLYGETMVVAQPLIPGDMLLLDAQRVLWGQAPFRAGSNWHSMYECGFISRDDAMSRTRLLRRLMDMDR